MMVVDIQLVQRECGAVSWPQTNASPGLGSNTVAGGVDGV
jgi:hypothetical protein